MKVISYADFVNEGTTPQFKALIKRAKELGIEEVSELDSLIGDEFSDEDKPITGADYEIAKKQLKLTESAIFESSGSGISATVNLMHWGKDKGQLSNTWRVFVTIKSASGETFNTDGSHVREEQAKKLIKEFGATVEEK